MVDVGECFQWNIMKILKALLLSEIENVWIWMKGEPLLSIERNKYLWGQNSQEIEATRGLGQLLQTKV